MDRPEQTAQSARTAAALVASCVAAAPVFAQFDNAPEAVDTKAAEIIGRAADFLIAQDQIAVNWFVSYDDVIDGREKITRVRSGTNILSRELGFYSYAENGPDTREYFYDGATFTVLDVEENAFATAAVSGAFESLVDQLSVTYDLTLPIWQILSRSSTDHLLVDARSGAYLGETRIAGQAAHHLAFSSYDQDWQVWVSTDPETPVLLMLVGTEPYVQGWPQFRVYFADWNFASEINADQFTFIPDEGAERMAWPSPARLDSAGP